MPEPTVEQRLHSMDDSVAVVLERNKQREIGSGESTLSRRESDPDAFRKPFGQRWGSHYWTKWAAISESLHRLGVEPGAEILDVGCGEGWTSLFLAESGYCPTGIDIAPAHIKMAIERAERWEVERRWGVTVDFIVADMDRLSIPKTFDAALVFDALHHSARQDTVVGNIASHLDMGAWVLFGEPSWLHRISPGARRATRDYGWIERGITVRSLKRDCSRHGLGRFRRFHEGTRPYESRGREFLLEAVRLVAGNFFVAPQTSIWLAAQRLQ